MARTGVAKQVAVRMAICLLAAEIFVVVSFPAGLHPFDGWDPFASLAVLAAIPGILMGLVWSSLVAIFRGGWLWKLAGWAILILILIAWAAASIKITHGPH